MGWWGRVPWEAGLDMPLPVWLQKREALFCDLNGLINLQEACHVDLAEMGCVGLVLRWTPKWLTLLVQPSAPCLNRS